MHPTLRESPLFIVLRGIIRVGLEESAF